MRWPLRNQIMFPMAGVMLATLLAVSVLNAWLSVRRTTNQIQRQLREVAGTLADSSFPLNDRVLRQMHGLSAAHYVLRDEQGRVLAASLPEGLKRQAGLPTSPPAAARLTLGETTRLDGERYLLGAVALRRPDRPDQLATLQILYPSGDYSSALWQAAAPPLLVGGVAIALVGLLAALVASRVSRPLADLRQQVERIAHGEFRPLPLPAGNDEVRDLAASVNRMAVMLASYEREVRRSEQLRTLGQLSSGIAHQMRNTVTGCRMALDLHARGCSWASGQESLDVARRQIVLMETHLRRFLAWGRLQDSGRGEPERLQVDLNRLLEGLLPLLRPAADHHQVRFDWRPSEQPVPIRVHPHDLEQAVINLLLNAFEAASAPGGDAAAGTAERMVQLRVEPSAGSVRLEVADTGPGPPPELQPRLFDPFVTGKPDGTGLGLSVARQIVEQHHGKLSWNRGDGVTRFVIELPADSREAELGEDTRDR